VFGGILNRPPGQREPTAEAIARAEPDLISDTS
jgi:hypothetical protein